MDKRSNRQFPDSGMLEFYERKDGGRFLEALDFIAGIQTDQGFSDDDMQVIAEGLALMARWYHFGQDQAATLREQRPVRDSWLAADSQTYRRAAAVLAVMGRGRPARTDAERVIWIGAMVYAFVGKNPGTVQNVCDITFKRKRPSPFQRFCNGWISWIDPETPSPSRKVYRKVLAEMRRRGLLEK